MANRTILLCLLILSISIYVTECGRFGGGRSSSRGSSRSSGSSWGKSWGGGSSYKPSSSSSWGSGSSYKPSSSSSWGSGSSYKPSSSWNTGSSSSGSSYKPSSSSGSHSYPSSSTGLSGSSSGSHSYPSSGSGLSGSGSYNPFGTSLSGSGSGSRYPSSGSGLSGSGTVSRYPSSSSGLSGSSSGSGSHYPSSGSGLSGSSSGSGSRYPSYGSGSGTHSYPSGTGLSGSGSGSRYPSSGSGSGTHSYPSGTGLSGSGSGSRYPSSGTNYRPTNVYTTNTGYGSSVYHPPTIYHYPQHVYVTQYRDSGSRYGDLLTGLTLYNMGRSHSSYHHDHYYYDDYYRTRYYGPSSSGVPQQQERPRDEAICTLRVVENGKVELLKIPCEIVSTFSEGSNQVNNPKETLINQTICTTNTTVIKKTEPKNVTVVENESLNKTNINNTIVAVANTSNATNLNDIDENLKLALPSSLLEDILPQNVTNGTISLQNIATPNVTAIPASLNVTLNNALVDLNATSANITSVNGTSVNVTSVNVPVTNTTTANDTSTENIAPVTIEQNVTEGNKTIHTVRLIKSTEEIVNVTVCTTTTMADPMSAKGPPIDPSRMECSVDIKTRDAYFRNNIDCSTLIQYSKKPLTAQKPNSIMPEREKLKQWLNKPPWWMSMFIAV